MIVYLGIELRLSEIDINKIRFFECRNEFWKKMKNHEDRYIISSFGRIIAIKNNGKRLLLSQRKSREKYRTVILTVYKKGAKKGNGIVCQVGKLVARTFCPLGEQRVIDNNRLTENKGFINHKDLNPFNNHYSNIEWVNLRENKTHSVRTTTNRTFTSKYTGVSKSKKLFRADISVAGKKILIGRFKNELDAAIAYDNERIKYGLVNKYQAPLPNA